MQTQSKPSVAQRLKTIFIGGARSPRDPSIFYKLSLIPLFAWVGLGADALSSSCYGPEAAFLALHGHTYLAIFVALGTVITIFIISASYSQIVELFPTGGGGYLVASKLLSPKLGVLSGCALYTDYILTIAVSVASGMSAIFSFLPAGWYPFRLEAAVAVILILILLNLRGIKESVLPLAPIFLFFIITHVFVITYAIATHFMGLPVIVENTASEVHRMGSEVGLLGIFLVIMRAYSMGAGTYTGIEAVSNGIPILREPRVENAKRTMRYMAISLSFMALGLMIAYLLYGVEPQSGKTLNAILLERITVGWGGNLGYYFVLATLISEGVLLFVAAQTGFLDGPRVMANMALDRWFPARFATLSDRLVTQNGILVIGGAALAIMILAQGSVGFLIVLYSITVFITFVLSQSGMVRHWWNSRSTVKNWKKKLAINGVGLILTCFILVFMIVLKFNSGGWITFIILGALIALAIVIKRHYDKTAELVKKLDILVPVAESHKGIPYAVHNTEPGEFDPNAKTAVLLVNGFNGLGLSSLSSVFEFYGATFKNFVFVQIGVVDAGVFKGATETERLQIEIKNEVERYIKLVQRHGYHAEGVTSIGIDIVDEIVKLAPEILEHYPNATFFGGQIAFPKDSLLLHVLHNNTISALRREFGRQGFHFVILPSPM
jgi:amino acid transporter